MSLDALLVHLSRWGDVWSARVEELSLVGWLLFFAPAILLEIPYYYVPLWGVVVARALGFPRVDLRARAGFLGREPAVSVVVAGRNEAAIIAHCIESLLELEYPNLEIIVVDDASTDETYAIASKYARRGLIRVIRNRESVGRTGRPTASNLGMRLANGELIISLDADTTFDRGLIGHLIAPFADPRIGIVAGNVLARNSEKNMVTRLQTLEYVTGIDMFKRWTSMLGSTLQASGAIGAFRRKALLDIGGWDPELTEDCDLSMRLVKRGWRIAFAHKAVSLTAVPETLGALIAQRTRWDRGGLRTYFFKHGRLLRPSASSGPYAYGMWGELTFSVVLPMLYPFYLVWLLAQGMAVFSFVLMATWVFYTGLTLLSLIAIAAVSERSGRISTLVVPALLMPFYRELLRWAKIVAILLELLRVRYEDGYLPESAWSHAPRF